MTSNRREVLVKLEKSNCKMNLKGCRTKVVGQFKHSETGGSSIGYLQILPTCQVTITGKKI